MPMPVTEEELYKKMQELTDKYAEPLRKYYMIVIGVMLYIAYLVMAYVFFRPSYFACIGKGGSIAILINSVLNAVFFVTLVLFLMRPGMPEESQKILDKILMPCMYTTVILLVMSNGILFYTCKDPAMCGEDGCNVEDQTAFNALILEQVNGTKIIRKLKEYYAAQLISRADLSLCSNYYNSSYRDASISSMCLRDDQTALPACNVCTDTRYGAPVLAEFFVSTAARCVVVEGQYDQYVTDQMIDVAYKGGARCFDFDVYPHTFSKNATPIVTVGRDRDNVNLQRNYVLLEKCFQRLASLHFSGSTHRLRDPLFIHLKLHRSVNKGCQDIIAKQIVDTFFTSGGAHLLPIEYHYSKKNIGRVPICLLYNKLIIMVHTCEPKRLSSMLDGLINVLSAPNGSAYVKEVEWSDVKSSNNKRRDYLEFARQNLVFVRPSYHPYSMVSNDIACNEKLHDSVGRYKGSLKSDSVMDLIMRKETINNDPIIPMSYGCQFVGMNFQILDQDMRNYIGFFKRASLVIKPAQLRRKDTPLTEPIPQEIQYGNDKCHAAIVDGICMQACINANDTIVRSDAASDNPRGFLNSKKCVELGYTTNTNEQQPITTDGLTVNYNKFVKD